MTTWTNTLDTPPTPTVDVPTAPSGVVAYMPPIPDTFVPDRPNPVLREAPVGSDFLVGYTDAVNHIRPPEKFTLSYAEGYTFGAVVNRNTTPALSIFGNRGPGGYAIMNNTGGPNAA